MDPSLLPLFRPEVQDFLIDEMSYNPVLLIKAVRKPVLILQGERDIQVNVEDARHLKNANPKARLILLPNTNHVLKTVTSGARDANIATYADPGLSLAPGVVTAIADFIKSSGD
jgi:dipeptidyl aminopeptidase/acylaminoacyl peptidase